MRLFRWLQMQAGRWAVQSLDLVYPPCCPICRREVARETALASSEDDPTCSPHAWAAAVCGPCTAELSADGCRCPRCGEAGEASEGCRCCSRRRSEWGRIVVLSTYGGGLRDAILRAKRPSGEGVAAALASLIVRKHGQALMSWGVDRVVPVPMHWLRRSMRGTSAADELARQIAGQLGLRSSRAIVRCRATRMQNELPIEERPHNVERAFRARHRLDGERILLVDDVVTTGATLGACSRALVAAGAAVVDVAVVAKADRRAEQG